MKFFHLGDLHFGKSLHNVELINEDQPYWVEQFFKKVDEYEPDAVVIAGDIFDRALPSTEAIKLFDKFILELTKRDKYAFIIPGNHDSSIRLSQHKELLAEHKIYIAGELDKELMHITVKENGRDITFWLMPYIYPGYVSQVIPDAEDELTTYDKAVRKLLSLQDIDPDAVNILVAHQNVLSNGEKPEHSRSESIIGGLGEIDQSAFEAFDYVALGHIHNAQKIGKRETVRYAGCPLYYDFSEEKRKKDLTLVTVNDDGTITVDHEVEIPLLHTLHRETGTLEELLEAGRKLADKDSLYVQCIITDKHIPARAMEQLRDVYGSCFIDIIRKREKEYDIDDAEAERIREQSGSKSVEEFFTEFYQSMNDELLDEHQEKLIERIIEQQGRNDSKRAGDPKDVPDDDSDELLELLISMTEGGAK